MRWVHRAQPRYRGRRSLSWADVQAQRSRGIMVLLTSAPPDRELCFSLSAIDYRESQERASSGIPTRTRARCFGFRASRQGNSNFYALKTLKKAEIMKMKQVDHIVPSPDGALEQPGSARPSMQLAQRLVVPRIMLVFRRA